MGEFQVQKKGFEETRIVDQAIDGNDGDISDGEILVKVDAFGFSANNITYAAVGHQIGYWQFFPPADDDGETWGIIPVWGFATITASKAEGFIIGERLFGYFPPAGFLKLEPSKVSPSRFIDASAHRAALPAGYNAYTRVEAEPGYDRANDKERMLLWPLFITSFCLYDFLQDNDWYGAEHVIIVSASAKTSIGLAYGLDDDENAPAVVGVTSARNVEMVKGLGAYDQTVSYDDLTSIDASKPSVIVDMSGNGDVLAALHRHLGDNMKFTSQVGLTHWDESGAKDGFIAERSALFFAPSILQKRMKDWGPEGFQQKSGAYMGAASTKARSWLKMVDIDGLEGLSKIYDDVRIGKLPPEKGLIVTM